MLALNKLHNDTCRWPNKIQEETEDKYKCVCIMGGQRDGRGKWRGENVSGCKKLKNDWKKKKSRLLQRVLLLFLSERRYMRVWNQLQSLASFIFSLEIYSFLHLPPKCLPALRVYKRSFSHSDLNSEVLSVPCSNFLTDVLVKGLRELQVDKRRGSADRWTEHLGCLMHCVHLLHFMVGKATERLKICFRFKFVKNTLQVYSSKTETKLNAVLYHKKVAIY